MRKAPHKTVKRFSRNGLYLNLRPARQPEHDPVLAVNRHAVHQPGPQALVELGDELRQFLYALDEPLDLPAQLLPTPFVRVWSGGV